MFYHRYLKQINNQTGMIEQDLEKSTRNQELHRLLKMEKCLVYFTNLAEIKRDDDAQAEELKVDT